MGIEKREGWVGSDLLSHKVALAVPSALVSLTAGFGMEPGGPSPLKPPTHTLLVHSQVVVHSITRILARSPPRLKGQSRCLGFDFIIRSFSSSARVPSSPQHRTQSPRPLVRVSSTHCCASTSRLSTRSSTWGLTRFRDGESHLEVSFPLRCFQRLSAPEIATRLCRWHDNRHTSAPSTPVLSY